MRVLLVVAIAAEMTTVMVPDPKKLNHSKFVMQRRDADLANSSVCASWEADQ